MAGNISSSSLDVRFKGLGAALMDRFGDADGADHDFSQSVLQFAADAQPSDAATSVAQAQLRAQLGNQITLSIKTVGGAEVNLTLSSQENGLGVQVQISNGKLTDVERDALQKLSGAFQKAIDGLSRHQPRLDLAGLMQFDPAVLSSVDLHASVKPDGFTSQTIDFHADSKQRTLSASGATGTLNVRVDMSNPTIIGSAKQQAQAIDSYLKQFDYEQSRGQGDASLMAMFKDAFSEMNSNVNPMTQQQRAEMPVPLTLDKTDRSMLTGLADFSASIRQTAKSTNPMRPGELDAFSYQTSQESSVQGKSQLNRAITQMQRSNLDASFHQSLRGSLPLDLTSDKASQNYFYNQIHDSASSTANIAYHDGLLVNASLKQSASQLSHVMKYVMGNLEKDTTTPSQAAQTRNLLALLKPSQQNAASKSSQDLFQLQQTLDAINKQVFLKADPEQLRVKVPELDWRDSSEAS